MRTPPVQIAFATRYLNIIPVGLYASGMAVPADRHALLACTGTALAATAVLHAVAARTGKWRESLYVMLGVDIVTIGLIIFLTGMVASPFMLLLILPFGMVFFLDHSTRAVVWCTAATVGWLAILFAIWWIRHPEVP